MRESILVASLAVLVASSSIGCKSMPSMTWWKTASKDNAEAETLAHSAPQLPSEIAKQAEGLAANSKAGEAAPFVPGSSSGLPSTVAAATSPGAYPSTSAPSFSPSSPSPDKVAASPTMPGENLGSIPMPYNPNAVPPLSSNALAEAASPPAEVDRYATTAPTSSLPQMANTTSPATPSVSSTLGSRYNSELATKQQPVTSGLPDTTSAIAAAAAGASDSTSTAPSYLGDRYAQTTAAASPQTTTNMQSNIAPATSTAPKNTELVSAQPYRPGGTSSYPGSTATQPVMEVASRPSTPGAGTSTTVPNVATPAGVEQSPPQDSLQPPRYR